MTAPVISDRERARKRGLLGFVLVRLAALFVTIAVLLSASQIARLLAPPPAPPAAREQASRYDPDFKRSAAVKIVAAPEPAAPTQSPRAPRRQRAAHAPAAPVDDGFTVLSPAELAAISQARD